MKKVNFFSAIAAVVTTYGGPVWEQIEVLGTVKDDQFEMTSKYFEPDGDREAFTSFSLKIVNGDQMVFVNIKSDEPTDSDSYELVKFVALRDLPGTKVRGGDITIKAVAS